MEIIDLLLSIHYELELVNVFVIKLWESVIENDLVL
jgi:hypothetical protein